VWQSIVDESFASFRSAVEERRAGKLDPQGFAQALDARIMTGRQAKAIGLVDELGSKDGAIAAAARLANMTVPSGEKPRLCEISSPGRRGGIFGSLSASALQLMLGRASAPELSYQ
jgi:protease-4